MKNNFLNKILLFVTLVLVALPTLAQHPGRFTDENKIIISGESNIQDFVVRYFFKGKLEVASPGDSAHISRQNGVIQIPVDKLLFSNRHMRDDFLNLVQADQFPLIKLYYDPENLNKFGDNDTKMVPITIQITNVKKTYEVPVSLLQNAKTYTKLNGQIQIKLSDFKLKPKRYFFGLIRIKDMLNINFILYFYHKVT